MARDNEQPILALDPPARPRVAEEWAEYLSSMEHRRLLLRALDGVVQRWGEQVVVPEEADAVMEKMFDLPAGSGRALRAGLPLPDSEERVEKLRQELAEAERRGYQRGRRDERYETATQTRPPTTSAVVSTVGMSRQQRRAAARKRR